MKYHKNWWEKGKLVSWQEENLGLCGFVDLPSQRELLSYFDWKDKSVCGWIRLYISYSYKTSSLWMNQDTILYQLVKQFVSVEEQDRAEFPIIDRLIELNCPEEFINLFR